VRDGIGVHTPGQLTMDATAGFRLTTQGHGTVIANGGWTVVAPGGQTQVDSYWRWTGSEFQQQGAVAMTTYGMKLDYTQFAGYVTDLKVEAGLSKLAATGLKFEATAKDFKKKGLTVEQVITEIRQANIFALA
jgi:type VI secretion system secreted protein VgrG